MRGLRELFEAAYVNEVPFFVVLLVLPAVVIVWLAERAMQWYRAWRHIPDYALIERLEIELGIVDAPPRPPMPVDAPPPPPTPPDWRKGPFRNPNPFNRPWVEGYRRNPVEDV